MPWPVYLAFKQIFPTGKLASLLHILATVGVMLGVAVLFFVISVMGGFGNILRDILKETNGDITVRGRGIMNRWETLADDLRNRPEVAGVMPFATGPVGMIHRSAPTFPFIRTIDINRADEVIDFEQYLLEGSVDDLDDDSIFLSSVIASQLGAYVGSTVEVYTPLLFERIKRDEVLLPRELEVRGIFEVGYDEIDRSVVITTLSFMQDIYGLGYGVHGLTLRLEPGYDENEVRDLLNEEIDPAYFARTWRDENQGFLWILDLEKNLMFVFLGVASLVSAFAIGITLYASVLRKIREIGLLAAMGGDGRQVLWLYILQGLFIGVVGTIGGFALGGLILAVLDPLIQGAAHLTGTADTLIYYYNFSTVPIEISPNAIAIISVFSISIATFAAVLPAIWASWQNPAEALRSE